MAGLQWRAGEPNAAADTDGDDEVIAIVVGMHRSGTSALAGMLHRQGIVMGENRHFRPRPSIENPKGYYENFRFRTLSDRVLSESAYHVKSWDPAVPEIHAGRFTRFRIRRVLSSYSRRYSAWGWKDPRLCLTLSIFLEELDRLALSDQVKLVYVFREPGRVAQSMVRRGNTDHETAVKLWTVYNQRVLDLLDRRPVDSLFVPYHELCYDALRTSAVVCEYLGVGMTRPRSAPSSTRVWIARRTRRSRGTRFRSKRRFAAAAPAGGALSRPSRPMSARLDA